jgi:hypothetical protein
MDHRTAAASAVAGTYMDKSQRLAVSAHKDQTAAARRDQSLADTLPRVAAVAAAPEDRRDMMVMMAMTDRDQVGWVDIAYVPLFLCAVTIPVESFVVDTSRIPYLL